MKKQPLLWVAAILLLLTAVLVRIGRPDPPSPAPAARELLANAPDAPAPSPPAVEPRSVAPAGREAPERLLPWMEKLGRARLLRDRRTLEALWKEFPQIYKGDIPWLCIQLRGNLFVAAGAAEVARAYGLSEAVPEITSILASGSAHPFLKGIAIETLGHLKGDAAAVALLGALQGDPDPGVRIRAAAALAAFRTPEAIHGLSAALRDLDPAVRSAATEALGALGDLGDLFAALETEPDPRVQAALLREVLPSSDQPTTGRLVETHPAAVELLRSRARLHGGARYRRAYDAAFFEPGGAPVPWDPSKPRIGITVELGPDVSLFEVAGAIFSTVPFDRYRSWFILRRADEFPSLNAYDSYGSALGEVPGGDLDGSAFLRFRDPQSFAPGVLGLTEGKEALVTRVSLLHELGHAFARLEDEYVGGSDREGVNLSPAAYPPWQPLADSGLLPPPVVRDAVFFIPSGNCHMSNHREDSRFCPACQLEIHARIAELAGAPLPW